MPTQATLLFTLSLLSPVFASSAPIRPPPNVLFIAIDDQNDWVGPLRGHPQAKTPHLDRLAREGVTFHNAHCNAPLCNPSRTSLLLGLRPSSTGIYGLSPWFRSVPSLQGRLTLPQCFQQHGYQTLTTGKIFHGSPGGLAQRKLEFDVWGPEGGIGIRPPAKLIGPTPMGNHPLMDWGAFPHRDEEKGDYQIASWAVDRIQSLARDRPFFLAVGFFLPHVPCYVSPAWMELDPPEIPLLPEILKTDRADTPRFSWHLHWNLPEPRLHWVRENQQWENLVRSYLASTRFVDAQIGRILQALDSANLANNTWVVLWSDHGYHLGEKAITGKNTLWERSTRVPLLFRGPGIRRGAVCHQPVELLDLYPTLAELAGLKAPGDLEGLSLLPQLRHPATPRNRPALTTHNQGNHAVRSEHWRFIRYADGTEELYDHRTDPHEWHNLANRPSSAPVLEQHRRALPKTDLPPAPGSAHRILTFDPVSRIATWEGHPIEPFAPVPD
ncbi:MAG: sulfatase [Verrucomicrobia bacterium]|nr:sulfatase [Verrucomicrobiota bacterium]